MSVFGGLLAKMNFFETMQMPKLSEKSAKVQRNLKEKYNICTHSTSIAKLSWSMSCMQSFFFFFSSVLEEKSSHTNKQRHAGPDLALVGKVGIELWIVTLNWSLDPSLLRQNQLTGSCQRQILSHESKVNTHVCVAISCTQRGESLLWGFSLIQQM